MRARTQVALAAALLAAALSPRPQAAQVFRSTTDLVNVWATVTDRSGRVVPALTASAFTVKDEGVPQEVTFFRSEDDTPISVAIVVDTSGSMVDKLADVQDALRHFIRLLRPEDEVFLLRFSDDVEQIAAPADRDRLEQRIGWLRAAGGTALFDATRAGADAVAAGQHAKRVVLLITDGNDTSSRSSRRNAVDAVTRSEALLYAVGIGHGERASFGHDVFDRGGHGGATGGFAAGDRVDGGTLRNLAEPTGGRHYVLEQAHRDGRDLVDEAIQEIAQELRQQYSLGYYTSSAVTDAKFRRITVEMSDRSLKVRARRGYIPRAPSGRARYE
ncbi:MAG: VWA domain-containing protein [Cyanobacteria bacterium]|nr:VWA domain-containing protein [Cyanobacteriota bacterium]